MLKLIEPRKLNFWQREPKKKGFGSELREITRYSQLILFFSRNALERLYSRTFLGIFWLFFRPVMTVMPQLMVIFLFIDIESSSISFPLYLFSGLLVWVVFEQSWLWVTRSLEANRGLMKKIYIPKLILPLSFLSPALLYFSVVLVGFCAVIGFSWDDPLVNAEFVGRVLIGLVFIIPSFLLGLGLGFFTAIWGVNYRDIRFSVRYLTSFGFFLTPVAFDLTGTSELVSMIIAYNPLTGVLNIWRNFIFFGFCDLREISFAFSIVFFIFLIGLRFFIIRKDYVIDDA